MSRPSLISPLLSRLRRTVGRVGLAAALAGSLVAASGLALAQPANAAPLGGPYVALGDSFTSGPGIPPQVTNAGFCGRSQKNYPSVIKAQITPTVFKDVSCGGAVLSSFSSSFLGQPPQYDALTSDTKLVTIGIGGNDVGFGAIAGTCIALFFLDNNGAPCKTLATFGGSDSWAKSMDTWAPKLGTALDTVKQRAPRAKIVVVGYPSLLPQTKAQCESGGPIATGDVPYLHNLNKHLNTVIEAQAKAKGATFVDVFTPSLGHDLCKPVGTRWVEGIENIKDAAPIHPNALGMENIAKLVLAKL